MKMFLIIEIADNCLDCGKPMKPEERHPDMGKCTHKKDPTSGLLRLFQLDKQESFIYVNIQRCEKCIYHQMCFVLAV